MRYVLLAAVAAMTVMPVAASAANKLAPKAVARVPLALAPVWGDHAVIQRDKPIAIAGKATPGQAVSGKLGEASVSAVADAQGRFVLNFPARGVSSSGVELVVSAGAESVTLRDLLVGDVYLCSGQSNMEFAAENALNGRYVAMSAKDDGIRLIEIPKTIAYVPQEDFGKKLPWAAASPASVARTSAVCYFMARDLRKALNVPIGTIHSSWGGSAIRAWLSPEAGSQIYGAQDMALLAQFAKDPLAAVTAFAPRWEQWHREATGGLEIWAKPDSVSWAPVPKISGWLEWAGTPLASKATGTVWLRQQVTLTKAQATSGGLLTLGILDDMDATWVNGKPVGNSFGWDYEREYKVPPAYLREGVNEILVAVTNTYADGGFKSAPEKLGFAVNSGERFSFASGWRYAIAPAKSYAPRAPWDANAGIGVMHNRMVAPLGQIALKGAAWYQGESDVDTPGYDQRLTALIAGWRKQFGSDLQVGIVQLANYGPVQIAPVESGWGRVRDDERKVAAADPKAALVAAFDLGERSDIHPANKLTLGQRMALAALGKPMPMPVSAAAEGGDVRIKISGIEGGLHSWSGLEALGFELCAAQGGCRFAHARVDGDSVVVSGDGKAAARVRYAWADSPIVNLFDGRQLPVPGFELPVN